MKFFYKILDNKLCEGSGSSVPDGFTQYSIGQEPDELISARIAELSDFDMMNKVQSLKRMLDETQWIESYLVRHEQGIITIPYDSNKWVLHANRIEAIAFLKENGY